MMERNTSAICEDDRRIGQLGKIFSIGCCVLFLNFSQLGISSPSSLIGGFS